MAKEKLSTRLASGRRNALKASRKWTWNTNFIVYGIRSEWLIVRRVINHRTLYLVKWREPNYDMASWEEEGTEVKIPGLKRGIEEYFRSGRYCQEKY